MEKELNERNFDEFLTESDLPVLVDFWAPWCGPCRILAPVVEAVADEYPDRIRVGKVNVDEAPALADRFAVDAIPLLILFRNGEKVNQWIGYRTKEQLEAELF